MNPCIKFHTPEDKNKLLDRRLSTTSIPILAEWENVLGNAKNEQDIQNFLERHPSLLPGLFDYHNGPLHGIVVSKFPFGADYVSDFAFVSRHSMALQFTFLEIEDPKKRIFTKNGLFTKEFNHARQQIADWKIWVEKNVDTLMNMFSPMFETYNAWNDYKTFRFYLLYGRRDEIELSKKRKERWSGIMATSDGQTFVLSYDRLGCCYEKATDHELVVCNYQEREFYAKSSVI